MRNVPGKSLSRALRFGKDPYDIDNDEDMDERLKSGYLPTLIGALL